MCNTNKYYLCKEFIQLYYIYTYIKLMIEYDLIYHWGN